MGTMSLRASKFVLVFCTLGICIQGARAQTGAEILTECEIDASEIPPFQVVDGIFGAPVDGPTVIGMGQWPPAVASSAPAHADFPESHSILAEVTIPSAEDTVGGWVALVVEGTSFPGTLDELAEPLSIVLFWAPDGEAGSIQRELGLLSGPRYPDEPDHLVQVGLRLEGNALLEVCFPGPELADFQHAYCDAYLHPAQAFSFESEYDHRTYISRDQVWPRDEYATARDLAGDGELTVLHVTDYEPRHPAIGERIIIPAATAVDPSPLSEHPYWRRAVARLMDEEPGEAHLERLVEVAAWLRPISATDNYSTISCLEDALSRSLAEALATSPTAPEIMLTLHESTLDRITRDVIFQLNADVHSREWSFPDDDEHLQGGFVIWTDDETLLFHRASTENAGTWLCRQDGCETASLSDFAGLEAFEPTTWSWDYAIDGADRLETVSDSFLSLAGSSQNRQRRYLLQSRQHGTATSYTLWLRVDPGPTWYRLGGVSLYSYLVDEPDFGLFSSTSGRYLAVVARGAVQRVYEVRALVEASQLTTPSDHYDSLDDACEAVAQMHREVTAWVRFSGEGDGPHGECVVYGDSAWAIQYDNLEDVPYGLEGQWWPVFVSAETGIVRAFDDPEHLPEDPDDAISYLEMDDEITYLSVGVFDFDGDGIAEGIFRNHHWVWESDRTPNYTILTYTEDGIVPYQPTEFFDVVRMGDFDSDGRRDFILDTPFYACECVMGYPIRGPNFLAHSLGDGTFSTDDETALDFLRDQCPEPQSAALSGDDWDILERSACARIWGVDVSTLTTVLTADYDGNCVPLEDVLVWVRAEPIVTLAERDGIRVTVSNFLGGDYEGYHFAPINLIDNELASTWQVEGGVGEWFRLDFDHSIEIAGLEIANGFQHTDDDLGDLFSLNARIATAVITFSDGSSVDVAFDAEQRGFVPIDLDAREMRWLEVRVTGVHPGSRWDDLAVSEVRVTSP